MEENNQQGMSLSAEKMFEKVGRLVMVNEELSEMLAKTKEQWQLTINENEKLKKETDEIVGEIFSKVSIEVPKTLVDSMLSMSQSIIESDTDELGEFADDVVQDVKQLPAPDSTSESEIIENKSD